MSIAIEKARRRWADMTPAQRQREIDKYEAWLEVWEFRSAIRQIEQRRKQNERDRTKESTVKDQSRLHAGVQGRH